MLITPTMGTLAALADNILVMREGEVAARGSEAAKQPGRIRPGLLFPEKNLAGGPRASGLAADEGPLLEVRGLSKKFVQQRMLSRRKFVVQSLIGIDLSLRRGSTVACWAFRVREVDAGVVSGRI